MTARDDFEIFDRNARRRIRDHVRDRGEVPGLAAVVSKGWNPRKLAVQMRLDLLPEALDVKAQMQGMVREHGSRYAAFCRRVEHEEGAVLLFVAVDAHRDVKWQAVVDELGGLGGWERSEFRFDVLWLSRSIGEVIV